MCVVSMIGDHYTDKWRKEKPDWFQLPTGPFPTSYPNPLVIPQVTKEEFDELRKQVLEMKELLRRAIKYDEDNNEPHCELDEKVALLKKVAEMVGIDLSDIFATQPRTAKTSAQMKKKGVKKS